MALLLGLTLGAGLFLVWWSFWPRETRREVSAPRDGRLRQLLARAGVEQVGPACHTGTRSCFTRPLGGGA